MTLALCNIEPFLTTVHKLTSDFKTLYVPFLYYNF